MRNIDQDRQQHAVHIKADISVVTPTPDAPIHAVIENVLNFGAEHGATYGGAPFEGNITYAVTNPTELTYAKTLYNDFITGKSVSVIARTIGEMEAYRKALQTEYAAVTNHLTALARLERAVMKRDDK